MNREQRPEVPIAKKMEFIAIGKIAKPIGTLGEMKILPLTDSLERFNLLRTVWIGSQIESTAAYTIAKVKIYERHVVIALLEVTTITEADALRDNFLFVPEENRIQPREGTYLIDAIRGCTVFDESNSQIGKVIDIVTLSANDIWIIQSKTKQFMIPAVKEFIRDIDLEHKRIIVHVIEGLLE